MLENAKIASDYAQLLLLVAAGVGGIVYGIARIVNAYHDRRNGGPDPKDQRVSLADINSMHQDLKQSLESHRRDVRISFDKVDRSITSLNTRMTGVDNKVERLEETTSHLRSKVAVALDRTEGARQ